MTTPQKIQNLMKRMNVVTRLSTRHINRNPSTMSVIGYRVKWRRDIGEEKLAEMRTRDIAWAAKLYEEKNKDQRYLLAKERLETFTNKELRRIIDNPSIICWDTHNYDADTKSFCPVAVAMNLHKEINNPTDKTVADAMAKRFNPVNIFKGAPGEFYTTNRKSDMITLFKDIIALRS